MKGDKGFHGDALDLEAHRRGCKPIDVLRKDGYLAKKEATATKEKTETKESLDDKAVGVWHAHSYFTAVDLIEKNHRNILENRKIELNEMSGEIDLGRQQIKDSDAHRIRYLIERFVRGGFNNQGNPIGMKLSAADIFAAINQIAHKQPYHPVRDYLSKLKWDGQPHIQKVVTMLGAENIPINHIIIKRFFISAVARPLKPGCKVDTVFILIGEQGAKKSGFFDALSAPWFVDTPIDIEGDVVRAYMTLRKAWILEWAELEALLRAKRDTTVKAFLSSRSDSYVPKHARYSIAVPRGGVIVGTTNTNEFLEDDTGERRYWPISVGDIDLSALIMERDQIWAEAVHLFQTNERWWLTKDEEKLLAPRHSEHKVSDVWAERVLDYATKKGSDGFTTGDVLREELVKEVSQWNRSDEMRISKILKSYGYKRNTDPKNLSRKTWTKYRSGQPSTTTGQPQRTT
jgi:predicted P-loop ATPase